MKGRVDLFVALRSQRPTMAVSSFLTFVLAALCIASSVSANYTFDLFEGTALQDEVANKSPSELDYTTGGGVPCVAVIFSLGLTV